MFENIQDTRFSALSRCSVSFSGRVIQKNTGRQLNWLQDNCYCWILCFQRIEGDG